MMSIISDLIEKRIDIPDAAQLALKDKTILEELLDGIQSSQDTERHNSFQVIQLVSEQQPDVLYEHWSLFENMIESTNGYLRLIAVEIFPNLIKADKQNLFDSFFDRYFSETGSEKTMLAAHTAGNAGKIALAKPEFQDKITDILLNTDNIYKGKQPDLVKGYAIESLSQYFDRMDSIYKEQVSDFVRKEINNPSPRTRKTAKEFLAKHEHTKP